MQMQQIQVLETSYGGAGDGSDHFDDDGRPKRTGTLWTASAHIITAVIGSGVLSLAWAVAQLGWIAGPIVMLMFSLVIYYTSCLLADCYRSGDPLTGKRNYTYMDVVRSNLGGSKVQICGIIQYVNLFAIAIGFTILTSKSMLSLHRSECLSKGGSTRSCESSTIPYMVLFGVIEIFLSQIPGFDQIWWLSIVAAVMSLTYSSIGVGLAISKVAANGTWKGSLTGPTLSSMSEIDRVWRVFQALGDVAFSFCYALILIEIQDTIRSPPSEAVKKANLDTDESPPSEAVTMKKANLISTVVTTGFYMLCGCMGYAAFGDQTPGNLLTDSGFGKPIWLVDIANIGIIIHIVGGYQVFVQPLFAFVEKWILTKWPRNKLASMEIPIRIPGLKAFKLNMLRVVCRSSLVVMSTFIAMLVPFFNEILGITGAFVFWPLSVYFPTEVYIAQKKIPRWGLKWIGLQIMSLACLMISIAAGAGSVAGVVKNLKTYKPFNLKA
ncbi:amino acid permease 4-like isoform X2 [Impatiens glandulifera]|uniref:amino acid permease 4-like isoform X2 n=1 Tax=Impatiens glandulifera TaxID=253017 RepID=UPI001FB09C01|nr:amino acid permease 4-like isoform X2 [Impatiens glandulifera]